MKTIILTLAVICFLSLFSVPTSAQYYFAENKAERDSMVAILQAAVENNQPITAELLEIALAVAGDNIVATTLKAGHNEYVSMPSKYPHGLMSNVLTDLNQLKQNPTNSTDNSGQLIDLDKKVTEVTGRVNDVEEFIVTDNPTRRTEIMSGMIFRFSERQKNGVEIITPPYKK
ncbi:MAG: hypothetical protein Q8P77_02615 [Candidatus Veblenbacteria bacterium]|nr:hypothetical protein [Candidatus Veblenbacteria bacterium]